MIKISIDPIDKAKVRRMFFEMQTTADKVISRSLNKTLTGVKTDASTEIRKELNAKKAAVDETFKMDKATTKKLTASIESTGKPLALIDFVGTRQTTKGVSVLIKKGRSRTIIPRAFIATTEYGHKGVSHKGVFWRKWHGPKRPKNSRIRYGALPHKFRLPVKERFGPRVPDIFSNSQVMDAVLEKAGNRLHANINHELEYELGKLK